jgi:hypothetical protein
MEGGVLDALGMSGLVPYKRLGDAVNSALDELSARCNIRSPFLADAGPSAALAAKPVVVAAAAS